MTTPATRPHLNSTRTRAAPRAESTRARDGARIALGGLLLTMAATQASDLEGFAEILRGYRLGPLAVAWVLGVTLVFAEAAAALALLSATPRVRLRGAVVALGVTLAWSGLAAIAFTRGIAIANCGCFGVHLGQPLRWWILLEDLEFIAVALLVLRALWRARVSAPSRATPRDSNA